MWAATMQPLPKSLAPEDGSCDLNVSCVALEVCVYAGLDEAGGSAVLSLYIRPCFRT